MLEAFVPVSSTELAEIAKSPVTCLKTDLDDFSKAQCTYVWQKLVETAWSPAVADKHLTAACNALCAVARYASHSEKEILRSFVYSENTWNDLMSAARKAFNDGKNKPALQILDTLVYLTQSNPDRLAASQTIQNASFDFVGIILTTQPASHLKDACMILNFLTRRATDTFSLQTVLTHSYTQHSVAFRRRCQIQQISSDRVHDAENPALLAFLLALIFAINVTESRTASLKLLSHLCSPSFGDGYVRNVELTSRAIELFVGAEENAKTDFVRDVFPALINDQDHLQIFLAQYQFANGNQTSRWAIFLALMEVGRLRNFINEKGMLSPN